MLRYEILFKDGSEPISLTEEQKARVEAYLDRGTSWIVLESGERFSSVMVARIVEAGSGPATPQLPSGLPPVEDPTGVVATWVKKRVTAKEYKDYCARPGYYGLDHENRIVAFRTVLDGPLPHHLDTLDHYELEKIEAQQQSRMNKEGGSEQSSEQRATNLGRLERMRKLIFEDGLTAEAAVEESKSP